MNPTRKSLHAELEERLRFETLLANLSTRFVGLPAKELDGAIKDAQRQICQTLGLDRSTLFQFNGAGTEPEFTHSWAAEGFQPFPSVPLTKMFPWGFLRMRSGHVVRFSSPDELPEEAATDKESFRRWGPKSNVTLPLTVGGELVGGLSFGALTAERQWPDNLVNRLRLVAEVFATALARRRSEEALRASEERLNLALDSAGAGLWSMDLKSQRVWMDTRMLGLLHFAASDDLTRDDFYNIMHPDDRETVRQSVRRALETETPFHIEFRVILPDGSLRWISSHGHRHYGTAAYADRLIGVSIDITERKRVETEAERTRDQLAHLGRLASLGELTASLAHELNQPLGAILRNTEAAEILLQSAAPDLEELRAIMADIRSDDERAGNVIDRLRNLLRRHRLELQPLNLARLVAEVVSLLRPNAMDRSIRLDTDLPASLPPALGDHVHLQQVLLNLITNGLDAMSDAAESDRRLVIRAWPAAGRLIEVAVSDSGPGIPEEALTRVFDPFFTTKTSGMGLGLAISRTIIEAHGGRIWVENNPTRGATFRFTLTVAIKGETV